MSTVTVRQLRDALAGYNGDLPVSVDRLERPLVCLHVTATERGPAMIIQAELPGDHSNTPTRTTRPLDVAKTGRKAPSYLHKLARRTLIRAMVRFGALSRDDGHGGYFVPPGWI